VAAANLELDVEAIPDILPEDEIDSDLLQLAIDELKDDYKLVLVMFYFEECSYKEIAAKLSIPIGTVMSRLARAKGHLRARLFQAEGSQQDTPARRSPTDASSGSVQAAGTRGRRVGR
jgi:RNA polymerase sigma-70 factor (ECF subfamily)